MLNGILHRVHSLSQSETSQHLRRFTGQRFPDVKARKFFLFKNERSDSLPEQKHGSGSATGAPADNQNVSFHSVKLDFESFRLVGRTAACGAAPESRICE